MEIILVNIGIVALIVLVLVSCVFVLAHVLQDNSVMDICYGPIFLITAVLTQTITDTSGFLPVLITLCIALWSTRLGVRIFRKNFSKPEDARYAQWRSAWSTRGRAYFILRSYLQINVLQGLVIAVVLLPFVVSFSYPHQFSLFSTVIGLIVFITGLTIETLADWQLDSFIARKKAGIETAVLMTKGLFAYSRRPNYFGETLIWWGLAIMVLPLPFGWIALASPLLITYIVTKVTGPMLEKQFLERYGETYREYMTTTSYFIPLPPKK